MASELFHWVFISFIPYCTTFFGGYIHTYLHVRGLLGKKSSHCQHNETDYMAGHFPDTAMVYSYLRNRFIYILYLKEKEKSTRY